MGSLLFLVFSLALAGKFLHVTDIHFDPLYEVGSPATCVHKHETYCCCRSDSVPNNGNKTAKSRRFGEYDCDTPLALVESYFKFAKQNGPYDFIIWTGDSPPHDVYTQKKEQNLENLNFTTKFLRTTFPDTLIVPSLGNHDYWRASMWKVPPSSDWMLNFISQLWNWLPSEAVAQLKGKRRDDRIIHDDLLFFSWWIFYYAYKTWSQGHFSQFKLLRWF